MSSRPERTPVASDLFTLCTKEKIDTWHVVRNHNAMGIVDRVICKSCGSEHKYRSSAASAASSGVRKILRRPSSSSAAPTRSVNLRDVWFEKLKLWGTKDPLSYAPDKSFAEGDVLKHSAFGRGAVSKLRGSRMDVLFESGMKVLPVKKKVLEF